MVFNVNTNHHSTYGSWILQLYGNEDALQNILLEHFTLYMCLWVGTTVQIEPTMHKKSSRMMHEIDGQIYL
jgi:hypothetical protein